MSSLAPAHKGYLYQDIATAYFLAVSLVEPVRSTTIDAKFNPDDRFDDLLVTRGDGERVRRQFKHSESLHPFARSHLSSESHDLRLDQLIRSWQADPPTVRAKEYRVCATWRRPATTDDRRLLIPANVPGSFGATSRCYHLAVDFIWPPRGAPILKCLQRTKRADFVAFAKRFVLELECPAASLDLDRPGPMEQRLLSVLADRVGFGRFPNHRRAPIDAAATLILLAYKVRGFDPANSTLSPERVTAKLGLVTDFGRVTQRFPFKSAIYVSVPDLRRSLLARVKAGGFTVLAGGPGAGKSWELTDLMRKLRVEGTIVATHYCYVEPGDPLVQSRIRLNTFYGNLIAEIVDALPQLREGNRPRYAAGAEELQEILDEAGKLNPPPRLVVIVDGLDHIARVLRDAPTIAEAETRIARDLLALCLPKNVSVLVGSQPGDHITQIAKAGTVLTVPPWQPREVEALVSRIPLGAQLTSIRLHREDRARLLNELASRSQGNALYCTYLCRELDRRLEENPGAEPLVLLRALPANDGRLSTYYKFLLESLDAGGRLVAETMGLIDFGVTPAELQEMFSLLHGRVEELLRQLVPILEQTRGQGGLRIYHESFRRYLLDQAAAEPGSLRAKLKDVIAWLDQRGFMSDPRAFRFLLSNLVRAGRGDEVLTRVTHDFVVRSVVEGHSGKAIDANLELYARVAAQSGDFAKLVRANELTRALGTCQDNLSDAYEYGTTYAALFGPERLAERLTFDGAPTFEIADGLKLCSFCTDAGVSPPWHAYLSKPKPTEERQNIRADLARFHGLVRSDEGGALRQRLVAWLAKAKSDFDVDYITGLARRWAEKAGAADLLNLKKESKCVPMIGEIFDLEFARQTTGPKAKAAATRVARVTKSAIRALEALRLGADPRLLSHWTDGLDQHDIGIGGRGLGEGQALAAWFCGIRIAAYSQPRLLMAETIRTRGPGWYRNWLAFVINLARIERRAVCHPDDVADEVIDALRELASDVEPFKGKPRAVDIYHARGTIDHSLQIALGLLQSPDQWRRALQSLKKISAGTTTSLQRAQMGPLTPSELFELVAPFAKRPELQNVIRRAIEPVLESQHHSSLYCDIASHELKFASLLMTIGDKPAALDHWRTACIHLCAYGMRKDITIYEILDNVRALARAGTTAVLDRLAKLLPMVYAVVQHTDGKETSHSVGQWFKELMATDEIAAAWLLGRSMSDDGGSVDYRVENALVHWIASARELYPRWRCRLEQVVEGPDDLGEARRRIDRLEGLRLQDSSAVQLEVQLLAASVHGDPLRFPVTSYTALRDYAARHGFPLPTGEPDISYREREDDQFRTDAEPTPPPPLTWKSPKTPLAFLRRLQTAIYNRQVSDDQLLPYCREAFLRWATAHRAALEEILTVIARSQRFESRAGLLAGLGDALAAAGEAELAARALVLAFAVTRGGGGWLSFGDEEHEDLVVRAFRASRPVALSVLAHEMARRLGGWGVTRHVIGFLGRNDDVALATAMWDEACDAMVYRLPGLEVARGPFLPFEPQHAPQWSHEDAALFLILSRISHPELRRKQAAICNAAWLVEREPTRCVVAFRQILTSTISHCHKRWVLHLLGQFEPGPFVLSQALAPELNALVSSGRLSLELLSRMLLTRAHLPITGQLSRTSPNVAVTLTAEEKRRILSLDQRLVSRVGDLWPEFPDLVAGRFETVLRSDEMHKARIKRRWEDTFSVARKSFPGARLHHWENELFAESVDEVLVELEGHLWSEGEWDDRMRPMILSWLLPSAQLPAHHAWSRRVRPNWPLPSELTPGFGEVPVVPDGELSGWRRIASIETYLDVTGSIEEIKLEFRVTTGTILAADTPAPLPDDSLPLQEGSHDDWLRQAQSFDSLADIGGPIAGHTFFAKPFAFHEVLGLVAPLAAALELVPRSTIGPLDLLDAQGNLAAAYRWWHCRPLGDHGFADETPRLSGGALHLRPDLFARLLDATKLKAFEAVAIKVKTTDDLIAERQ
ncbi:MAG: hypothetical protein JNJ82_11045 [Opitutaceae bacterium]|nr:hypothetical protein [Opitutaceae bacterium]